MADMKKVYDDLIIINLYLDPDGPENDEWCEHGCEMEDWQTMGRSLPSPPFS